jgi:hypothetical protein
MPPNELGVVEFESLLGETLVSLGNTGDKIGFTTDDGKRFVMSHGVQECCEGVELVDVVGDEGDLLGLPLTMAEVVTYDDEDPPDAPETEVGRDCTWKWTFYKMGTAKGYVTYRWYGTSNGCYSVEVDIRREA